MPTYPTKEQLEHDYYTLKLTQDQIAKKYEFKTRQPIGKLLKKYNLKGRNPSETGRIRYQDKNIPKETLEDLYNKTQSITEMTNILNVGKSKLHKLMKQYGIKVTYFKNNICNKTLLQDLHIISVKEASIKYGITTSKIKIRIKDQVPEVRHSKERLKEIINLYDIHNQGFTKAMIYDDPNVYRDIMEYTKDHKLFGNKITERIYRILNEFEPDSIVSCVSCKIPIKFYTMKLGYGKSDLKLCASCIAKQSAISKPSQELFWNIVNQLNLKDCYFSELNYEKTICISTEDRKLLANEHKINKSRYVLDFVHENKVIEYDGRYWHGDEEKEKGKDTFLNYKGFQVLHIFDDEYKINPQEQLNKCIRFLME